MAGCERLELVCSFTVDGRPASRGSKTAFRTKSGKINLVDGKAGYKYMANIKACAQAEMLGRLPVGGPIVLHWVARFERPKKHYLRGKLRDNAPEYFTQTPDASKIVRAVEDAMLKIVYEDDRQIVRYSPGSGKQWTCGPSHTEIAVFAIK